MISTQMLKGMLEGVILIIIEKNETYGYEISEMLSRYGFGMISEGTIYPILLRLEKNNCIKATYRQSSSGPKRKYFSITEEGKMKIKEFEDSYLAMTEAVDQVIGGREHE
ncbi:transcriptional regulator, PadR family [Lachnospiraceae bacterium KM106-2]|nr:transcriptional regulator, PadR family [Lachnospiraceae bacterium KM106-2]